MYRTCQEQNNDEIINRGRISQSICRGWVSLHLPVSVAIDFTTVKFDNNTILGYAGADEIRQPDHLTVIVYAHKRSPREFQTTHERLGQMGHIGRAYLERKEKRFQ